MSRIEQKLEALKAQGKKGLVPFITAGYPTIDQTVPLLHALVEGGADIIELGMPFSDPMADGPVIQRSSEIALANGMTTQQVLDQVAAFRQTNQDTPIVLMGYANPIENMGRQAFVDTAAAVGVDAVLVVDYSLEEADEFSAMLKAKGMQMIFMLAPTSVDDRIRQVGQVGGGYIYYVSLKGVTGSANLDVAEVKSRIGKIKSIISLPVAVGFGIRDAETARTLGQTADAVIIGSRIIQSIEEVGYDHAEDAVKAFLKPIRQALG